MRRGGSWSQKGLLNYSRAGIKNRIQDSFACNQTMVSSEHKIEYADTCIMLLSMLELTLIFGTGQQKLVAFSVGGDNVTKVATKVPHTTQY
jgi:hypothetical protein